MAVPVFVPLLFLLFIVLLLAGRAQVAKGSNKETANGAVLLTLAGILALLATVVVASADGW